MYFLSEDPKHKLLEKIRTWGGYFVFLLTTAVIGILIILHYNGYSFTKSGEVMRTGFVTVTSNPVKAEVYLDGQKLKGTTYMRLDIPVGSHDFVVRAQGYQEWNRNIVIEPSSIYWLDYIQLYPKDLKSYALQTLPKSSFKFIDEVYGKDRYFTASWQDSNLTLSLIDLNNRSSANIKSYPLTAASLGLADGEQITDLKVQEWNSSSNAAVLKLKTNVKEYSLFYDIDKPESVINVTKDYGLAAEEMHFSYSNKKELFYSDAEANIRIINLDSKIITKPLVKSTDVETYLIKDQDNVYFVKNGSLFIKKYEKDEATKVADLPALTNRVLKLNSYDSIEYIVDYGESAEGKSVVNVWRINGDKIVSDYSAELEGKITNYKLSRNARTVLFGTDKNDFATFIFGDKASGKFKLSGNISEAKWGGIFQIIYKTDDGFHLIDFTGDNDTLVSPDITPYPTIIDSDFKNVFYLKDKTTGESAEPELNLNAIDMRLND